MKARNYAWGFVHLFACGALGVLISTPAVQASFVTFESGQVRPLAMSPDGTKLFAVNTPDNRLEIFDVGTSVTHNTSVPVGMEPVAVAARTNTEVWVVNHLSDSISIVDVSTSPPRVIRTLLVGDEPRDIVFAGNLGVRNKAFITTAHRGQNNPPNTNCTGVGTPASCCTGPSTTCYDPKLTTAGQGRMDVWVFDATNLGSSLGGTPASILTFFGDTPRALSVLKNNVGADTVYAAVFHSGNQSTTVSEGAVCDTNDAALKNNTVEPSCSINGVTMPGGMPLPHRNQPNGICKCGNGSCSNTGNACTEHSDCPCTGGGCTSWCDNLRPEVGLVVKWNGSHWTDQVCPAGSTCSCQGGTNAGNTCTQDSNCPSSVCGRNWDNAVKFTLPDKDVFAINANTLTETTNYTHVGTILFNMAVNPQSGKVYVTNGEERNEVRFEGPGVFGASTVQGHLTEYRITVLDGANVIPRHLNKHIDYSILPAPAGTKDKSLATPMDMAVSGDGQTLYVAAFGSNKVGVFNTTQLENNTFTPDNTNHIVVSGGLPSGLVLDEPRQRLYVLTRFDNGISVVDLTVHRCNGGSNNNLTCSTNADCPGGGVCPPGSEVDHPSLYNPEPASVTTGRQFLYDANFTSSNGEATCSSCHIFGDMDDLAWDLGNPDDSKIPNPFFSQQLIKLQAIATGLQVSASIFHPMKGPMTTQTLRGMVNHGAMHWRGDRANQSGSVFDSDVAFRNFRVAFPGLVGRDSQIPEPDMQAFSDFTLQIMLPPNPNRAIDNSLTPDQQTGKDFMVGASTGPAHCHTNTNVTCTLNSDCPGSGEICDLHRADGLTSDVLASSPLGFACTGCHILKASNGHFGTDGEQSFENETQTVKVAHLRNLYQKVGMFGMPSVDFFNGGDNGFKGNQIRGFGFLHDGSTDTLFRFLQASVFNNNFTNEGFDGGNPQRRKVEEFLLAFDTDFAPVVGQQITLNSTNSGVVGSRISLLITRATTPFVLKGNPSANECDLTVKGILGECSVTKNYPQTCQQNLDCPLGETCLKVQRGWYLTGGTTFQSDRVTEPTISDANLRALASTVGQELTYTCVPPGSGVRVGVDDDEDGYFDRDEIDAGSDPRNPLSVPGDATVTPTPSSTATRTATPTRTLTRTRTNTPTPTPTITSTQTQTNTPAPPTQTPTVTPTVTLTPTETSTGGPTSTPTLTPAVTNTPTASCRQIDKPNFKVLNDLDPSGDEKLKLTGRWELPSLQGLDPATHGFSFTVSDSTGAALYSRSIPGGAGWQTNTAHTKWVFTDLMGTNGGITQVKVTLGGSGGQIKFKVKGLNANFQIKNEGNNIPVQLFVILGGLNDPPPVARLCGRRSFNPVQPTPVPPVCKMASQGKTLVCH